MRWPSSDTYFQSAVSAHNSNHNLKRINALLRQAGAVSAGRVDCFGEIGSTNSWLMAQPDIHGRVCLAELQTAGRGRRGRSWQAPRSSSVLLSLGWCLGDAAATGLSLVSGLAIVDGLRHAGVDAVGLKWPNDVMVGDKKLGGVLTELSGARCVVGMGINVTMPPPPRGKNQDRDHARDRNRPATERVNLKSLGHDIDRDVLAAALIVSHCRYLRQFCGGGFAQFVEEWNGLNVHRARSVTVELPSASFDGIVRGIDSGGALIVDQNGVRRRVISGEARVRAGEKVRQKPDKSTIKAQ